MRTIQKFLARVQLLPLVISLIFGPTLSVIPVFVPITAAIPSGSGSSGPNSGSTFADDNGTGTIAWTNPSFAQSSDDSRARASLTTANRRSHYLQATGFGFNIPSGSTIDGIVVDVEHSSNVANLVRMRNVQMIKGGSRTGTAYDGTSDPYTWPTSDTVTTYGSTTDLWGTTWTTAEINTTDFGVALVAQHDNSGADARARVDHIQITVYYTLPATTTAVTSSANPSTYGTSVTFTATVTGSSPTGSVEFFDGATSLGTAALSGGNAALSTSALAVGSHSITGVYSGDGGNATSTSPALTQVVNKATLTVTADGASRDYGDANPGFTASYSGFVNGEVLGTSGVTGAPSLTTLATPTSPVSGSPYAITAALGTLAASNYDFTFVAGNLTVNTATLTVSADSVSRAFGAANPTFTASYSGFQNGEILGTSGVSGAPSLTTLATPSSSVPGPYTITAALGTLAAGNYDFAFVDGLLTISLASTNTSTVLSSPNSSVVGDPVTLTGSVTGGLSPTGTIEFFDGATSIGTATVVSGSASITYTFTTVGNHSLTAIYSGDSNHGGSTGSASTQVVDKASPSTSTVLSAPNSSVVGDPVTLTGSVTGGYGPTGSIEFFDGATSLGSVGLSGGSAGISVIFTTVGSHNLTAVYSGDSNNNGSTSPTATVQVVDKASPSTSTVLSAPNSSVVGDPVTLTGSVTGGYGPTGTVDFLSGSTVIGSATLSGGNASFAFTFTTVGSYSITAHYLGDSNNNGSTSATATVQVVSKASPSTSTVLSAPNSSVVGDPVTLTGSVTGGYGPTGSIEFFDGATSLGSATLSGGSAGLSVIFTSVGSHNLTAVYSGDASNNGSLSPTATVQVVDRALPSTSTAVGVPNSSIVGDTVLFTASVTGGYLPSGTVNFLSGSTLLGSGTLLAGSATLSTTFTVAGDYSIHAEYLGDANNLGSSSPATIIQVVDKFQSSTDLNLSSNLSFLGNDVALTAVVTGFFPSGTVTIRDGGTDIGTITLSNGSGSFVTSTLALGSHSFDAVYGGDGNNIGSTSSSEALVVSPQPPENGGSRGHNVTSYSSVVHFVLANAGGGSGGRGRGNVAPGAFGGQGDNVIIPRQRILLCTLQRGISPQADASLIIWIAQYMAPFFNLQPAIIEQALQDPALCSGGSSASVTPRVTVTSIQQIMPVDAKGIPVSTSDVWNRCIRNSLSVSASDLTPLSCERYHQGHYWTHPDSLITFFWANRGRQQLVASDRQPLLVVPVK